MNMGDEDKIVKLPRSTRPSKRVMKAIDSVMDAHQKCKFKKIILIVLERDGNIAVCDGGFNTNEQLIFRGMLDSAKENWELE